MVTRASRLLKFTISSSTGMRHHHGKPQGKTNIQVHSTHVVCLLGRYRDPMFSKLKVTQFRVMGLHTGEFCQSINFRQSPLSKHPPVHLRRALTTAFEHDFLLTDKFCVSGGHGGELLVWDYLKSGDRVDNLLYCIPVWCPGRSEFLRTFTALTVSADGRYIGATTSDQLFVVDMVAKTVHARYSNGRRIKDGVQYSKNPNDGFPAGMWCWWKEWDGGDDAGWKEVDSGVAYLCEIEEDEDVQTVSDQDENTLPTVSGQEKNTSQLVSDVVRWKQAHPRCKSGVVITTITTTITTTYGPNPSLWGFSAFVLVIAVCFGLYLWGVQTVERGFIGV
jgi:hypothetical protein